MDLAVLTKPQAILFGPVFLWYILLKQNRIFELIKAVISGLLTIFLLSYPFPHTLAPIWLFNLYRGTMGGYKYYSLNAYNFFAMIGLNEIILENSKINYIVIPFAMVVSMIPFKKKNAEFTSAYILICIIFTFCTVMHERNLFPSVLICVMAYIYQKKKYG